MAPVPDPEFDKVYKWLDLLQGREKLSQGCRALIDDLDDSIRVGAVRIEMIGCIDRLVRYLETSSYGPERGRLYLECGRAFQRINNPKKAERSLREAVNWYQTYPHELGVANVLLAVLLWDSYDCAEALSCFRRAQEQFQRLYREPDLQEQARKNITWYRDRIADLDQWLARYATRSC